MSSYAMLAALALLLASCQAVEVDRCEFCRVTLMNNNREYFTCSRDQVDCLPGLADEAAKTDFATVQPTEVEHHMFAMTEDLEMPTWRMYSIIYDCCDNVPPSLTTPAGDDLDPSVAGCVKCTKSVLDDGYYFWQCEDLGKEGCPQAFSRGQVDFEPDKDEVDRKEKEYCLVMPGANPDEFLPFCIYK